MGRFSSGPSGVLPGFTCETVRFSITNVVEAVTSKQLTELVDADFYIMKEVMFYNWDVTLVSGYAHLNSASSDRLATRFGATDFNVFSAIIIDDDHNGKIGGALTSKPYIHISGGIGEVGRTIYGVSKYYYM